MNVDGTFPTATGQFESGSVQRIDPYQRTLILIGGAITLQTLGVTAVMHPTQLRGVVQLATPFCLP